MWWYRSWWLANISASSPDRAPLPAPDTATFVRIVESWAPPVTPGAAGRNITVYTNAPLVSLYVNTSPFGQPVPVPAYGAARFINVPFSVGSLAAYALASDGTTVLASTESASWGAPAALVLTLDAPNPTTGTGMNVYQDGRDVALVRATIVDR